MWVFDFIFDYLFLLRTFVQSNNYLKDKDKLKLISINKFFHNNRTRFVFHDRYICKPQDIDLWYYNCLTKVFLEEKVKLPLLVTNVHFDYYFDDDDLQNYLPETVTKVYFDIPFKKSWKPTPTWMTRLGVRHNRKLKIGIIPNSVKILNLGYRFTEIAKNAISKSVRVLNLGSYCNPIDDFIPNSVKNLYLPYFDEPLTKNSIPHSVRYLCLSNFNKRLEIDSIPKSLLQLEFQFEFDQEIDVLINSSLTHLCLGERFNRDINNFLSNNKTIIALFLNKQYIRKINFVPNSLKYLKASKEFFELNKDVLGDKVEFFYFK